MLRRSSSRTFEGHTESDQNKQRRVELLRLVDSGQWDKVRRLIKRKRLPELCDGSGLTPLALFLTAFAPIDIIKLMLEYDPKSTTKRDNFGATPLHLACLNGTTAETVKLIIEHDKGVSARMVDQDQYTVLHHAVEYICLMLEKRISLPPKCSVTVQSEHTAYLEIIQILCDVAPETVLHSTKDSGDTPLDIPHIILSRQEDVRSVQCQRLAEVYHVLKKTSIKVYTEKKKLWESAAHKNGKMKKFMNGSIPSLESSILSSTTSSK